MQEYLFLCKIVFTFAKNLDMCEAELDFYSWCAKVAERLTFIRLNVQDKRDIQESDYELLRVLFKPYYNGEYPLFETKMEGVAETAVQNTLFSDISSTSEDGINIEYKVEEPKTEET
jgi:hypothetical protein